MNRKLIGLISSFGLILALAVVPVISACAPAEVVTPPPAEEIIPPPEEEVTPPPEEEEVTPPPTTGLTGELVVLLPDLGSEVWGNNVGGGVDDHIRGFTNESLLRGPIQGEAMGYKPMLAERWTMSADGRTWDIYLRQGIMFNEGWGEFTTEDVLFSWQEIAAPGSVNGQASVWRIAEGDMASYEIVDRYHIRYTLKGPINADRMGWLLASVDNTMLSKSYYETVGFDEAIINPVGTSPWRLIEHKPAEYMKYEAVENHWRKTPEFKYLIVKGVPEESTRLAMMKTGVGDVVQIGVDNIAEMEAAGLVTKSIAGAGAVEFQFGGMMLPIRENYDPTSPWVPHQDEPESYYDFKTEKIVEGSEWNTRALKVRMAMFKAVNYDAILDTIFMGTAVRHQIMHFRSPGTIFTRSFEDWPLTLYDPVEAKALLVEAGYPDGFELTFQLYPMAQQPKLVEIGQAVAMDLEAIGITVKREMTEYAVQRSFWVTRNSAGFVNIRPWINPSPAIGLPFTNNTRNAGYLDGYESLDLDPYLDNMDSALVLDDLTEAILAAGDYLIARFIAAPIAITSRVFAFNPTKVDVYRNIIPPYNYFDGGWEYVSRP